MWTGILLTSQGALGFFDGGPFEVINGYGLGACSIDLVSKKGQVLPWVTTITVSKSCLANGKRNSEALGRPSLGHLQLISDQCGLLKPWKGLSKLYVQSISDQPAAIC